MAKLIAQRPVLYMGRNYERGDSLPAHDPKMVTAWLNAGSAAWAGKDTALPAAKKEARRTRAAGGNGDAP